MPATIPTAALMHTVESNRQSILKWARSMPKPIKEFIAIINKEVPTASFIGKPSNKTSAGINKNPPPAPSKPVTKPTEMPLISNLMLLV